MNNLDETGFGRAGVLSKIKQLHDRFFTTIENSLSGWGVELATRLVFAATLLVYYLNSGVTKLGDGLFGFLAPSAGAFAQILPSIAEQYYYDTSAIPFFPWHLVVIGGTVAEFVLPVLIILGLFTRLAALGMVGFILVQTWVDVAFHGAALGGLFNNQGTELLDQRLLWVFLMIVLVVKGAGSVSIDRWLDQKYRE